MNNFRVLEFLKATESAAVSAYQYFGLGDEKLADKAAVDAMRNVLNNIDISARVAIGEGERDKAPMLYIGEQLGKNLNFENKVDIAVDPLEGTTICAEGMEGSMSVIAITEENGFLHAPDVYMEKIAIGRNLPSNLVSLNNSIKENLQNLADAKRCNIDELRVTVLKRKRHFELVENIRKCGARVKLINDCDIAAVLSLLYDETDVYIGIGGAPEGVLSASALKSLGGYIEGRLIINTIELEDYAGRCGINNFNQIYTMNDMVKSESVFIVTGVTDGSLLNGVNICKDKYLTNSIVISQNNIMKIKRAFYF